MEKLVIFIVSLAFSSVHGNGCYLQTTALDPYDAVCESGLENLKNLIPQYVNELQSDYYGRRHYEQRLNNGKINLNISNLDLDTLWDHNFQYMNKNLQTLTINHLSSMPNRIKDFTNLIELKNGNDYELREMNLNIFLGLTQLQTIRFTHSFIESINVNYDSRTSNVNSIDFSHNLIETLPNSCFANFPHLTTLDLSHNLIQKIDILTFTGIINLDFFDISYNRIKEIGHNFVRLVNVKSLFLNNNMLTKVIEPNFITMNKLEKLDLSFNMLNVIEENSFQNLANIQELKLSDNNLTKISKGTLQNNTMLHSISLANNPLQKIESNVFQGQNITYFNIDGVRLIGTIERNSFDGIFNDNLNLSHGKIDSIESEAFTGLRTRALNLSYNILSNVSALSFNGILLIRELDLSNNHLSCIEFETTSLKQLQILYVQNNRISKVSKSSFENFVSLRKIYLSFNKILELEPGIFLTMNKLEFLDISNNYLSKSLRTNTFKGLSAVRNIQLMFNRFTSIQNNTFQELKSLYSLNCSHGELSSIGYAALENTGPIKVLDLSYNSLRDFILNSTSIALLRELRLNDNAINNITEQMPKIEKLNLANNNISKLTAKLFTSTKNLTVLDLSSNNGIEFEEIFENISFLSELTLTNIRKQINFETINTVSISKLDLSFNSIENVSSIFVHKIKDIVFLNLKSNKITFIEKSSFQSMPALTNLDLSFNLISFLQPGSFLQLNALKILNLHGNSIQALQFGVLDGLHHLETLNLSSNNIREFGGTILHNSPAIVTLALDDNVIEYFKFEEFVPSNIKVITIGGNPLSCHAVADIKKRKVVFTVTAEILDYHTENVDGVKCITNFVYNKSFSLLQNKSDINGTASFWILAKAIDGFRASVENFRLSIDKLTINNNNKFHKYNETQTYKTYVNIANNSDFNALIRNIASIESLMHNLTNMSQTSTKFDERNMDYNLQEKINVLNAEKDKMIKELHNHFINMKQDNFLKPDAQVKNPDDYSELKAITYFLAVCLLILVILSLSFVIFKLYQRKKHFQRDGYRYSSSQPITNVIELQDS